MPSIDDLPDPANKTVLLRLDLNVPLMRCPDGIAIADDFRITSALPTVYALLERNARVVVATHLGELSGIPDAEYRIEPVRRRLARLAPDVEVLENLRFFPGELTADPAFVAELVRGRDLYVNDAFATAHRPHASIVGPPALLPSAAGPLMHRELRALAHLRQEPGRPFVLVLGGAKVADKLRVLAALRDTVDEVLVGGAMANAFLACTGGGSGPTADGATPEVLELCREMAGGGVPLVLPDDLRVEDGAGRMRTVAARRVPAGHRALDIGPDTAARYAERLGRARTVFWNGPLGRFEQPGFDAGSRTIAETLARSSAYTVIGGGETAQFVRRLELADAMDHVSTGGGAALHYLTFGDLPALAALRAGGSRAPAAVPVLSGP